MSKAGAANQRASGGAGGAFVAAILVALVSVWIDDPDISLLLVPVIILLVLYAMWKVPLRISLLVLMFCAFVLENPVDMPAAGKFRSPLYPIGALMLSHMNMSTGIGFLAFSGMDLALLSLFLIALVRRSSRSNIDREGRIATPKPLVQLALVSIAGTIYVWGLGMLRGGDNAPALWQIDRVIHLPLVFLLFHIALRGPKDYVALCRTVLAAAVIKAVAATYIMQTVKLAPDAAGDTSLPYATTHHDSILFATAFVLVLSLLIHKVGRKTWLLALLLLPILVTGMVSNSRRMVWVQVGMVLLTLYFVTPMSINKRKIKRIAIVLSPIVAIYIASGWGSTATIFKPVATIRSVIDPSTDGSTMTREIENFDLIYTMRAYPVLGTGYGIPYWEVWPLPFMGYSLEQFCPHNSLLGLWVYCGYVGYTAMTMLWCVGVYFGMRSYHAAKRRQDRAAALMTFGAVPIYFIQCWGDMGLGSWIGVFTLGPALAMAGKLAVVTGAWQQKQRKNKAIPLPVTQPAVAEAIAPSGYGPSRPTSATTQK